MSTMTLILVILLVLTLGGGGVFYPRCGPHGFWPLGAVLAIVLILWLTGHLR